MKVSEFQEKIEKLSGNDELFYFDGLFHRIKNVGFFQDFDEEGKTFMTIVSGDGVLIKEMIGENNVNQ